MGEAIVSQRELALGGTSAIPKAQSKTVARVEHLSEKLRIFTFYISLPALKLTGLP